jgi:hypothetical protein
MITHTLAIVCLIIHVYKLEMKLIQKITLSAFSGILRDCIHAHEYKSRIEKKF